MKKLLWAAAAVAVAAGSLQVLPGGRPAAVASTRPIGITWAAACPAPPDGLPVDPRQTCGTLSVPLDYRHPEGRQISLAVSRIPATDPAKRRGVLLVNPGGPGSEGLNWPSSVAQATSKDVLAAYDIIGFDPRGVGHSAPVTCDLTAAELLPAFPYPEPSGSIADNVAAARSVAQRCFAASGDLLPYVTTANTARDMDRIRQALGEPAISYLGSSAGTYLGTVYASLFPRRADRVVLDSAVDPARVWYGQQSLRSKGVDIRFPDVTPYAAQQSFGTTPAEVEAAYLKLATTLDTHPVTIPGLPTPLTGDLVRYLTTLLLSQPDEQLPTLAQTWRAAADLAAGTATDEETGLLQALLPLASAGANVSPGVPPDNALAAAYAVSCDDVSWPRDVDVYAANVARDRREYPITAGSPATIWPCAFWPARPIEPPVAVNGQGRRNIMILQNERDPYTPLVSGQALHRTLGGRSVLVTVDAGGHLVYGNPRAAVCATDAANRFLLTGRLPSADLRCA